MFQSLRQNSLVYILHKGSTPSLEIGTVTNIPIPKPKYAVPPTFGQALEMVVDLTVKVNNQVFNYNSLPANADIADSFSNGESIVITGSREAMNAEILSYKQKSVDTINSLDFHKKVISGCDEILNSLNPEYAEKKQLQDEISTLKSLMSEVSQNLAALTEMMKTLTGKEHDNELNVGNLRKRGS